MARVFQQGPRVLSPWRIATTTGWCEHNALVRRHASGTLRKQSQEWRIWADLEKRDENLKLRLAQLMHDLHDLAVAQNTDESIGLTPEVDLQTLSPADISLNRAQYKRKLTLDLNDIKLQDVHRAVAAFADQAILSRDCFIEVMKAGEQLLSLEPTVLNLRSRNNIYVVGDLHGSILSLREVLRAVGAPSAESAVVFNGDFVDRGGHSAEVLATVVLLKLLYPQDVYLLRGNHEDGFLCTAYGFKDELLDKYPSKLTPLWESILALFGSLPICAVTPEAFIVHGGLPTPNVTIQRLEQITLEHRKRPSLVRRIDEELNWIRNAQDSEDRDVLCLQRLLWADPSDKADGVTKNTKRGPGVVKFGTDVSERFLTGHGLNYIIRSHEVKFTGYDVLNLGSNTAVYTVFSVANYPAERGSNSGAVLRLRVGQVPEPIIFNVVRTQPVNLAESGRQTLVEYVISHRHRLQHAFESMDTTGSGYVSIQTWAKIMQNVLEIDLDTEQLQQVFVELAGADTRRCNLTNEIQVNFEGFIQQYVQMHRLGQKLLQPASSAEANDLKANRTLEILYRNHTELNTVFRFLDKDGNGVLSYQEFSAGIELLNEHLPEDERMSDARKLFKALDVDGSGEIALDEFYENFKF